MLKPMAPTLTGSPRALGLEQADAVGERVEHARDHAGEAARGASDAPPRGLSGDSTRGEVDGAARDQADETSSRNRENGASSRQALPGLPCLDRLRDVSDVELLELFQQTERVVREANATKAQIAGEMKRRSPVSAGHSGLAARLGEKSPERLIQRLTGVGAGEARQLTATGVLMQDAESGTSPWLAPVADAVASGELSVGAAAAVANGLGERVDGVSIDEQTAATAELIEFARVATPEETANRARAVRDELDTTGVLDRELARRARRSMTWKVLADGCVRNVNIFDPESWARFHAVLEAGVEVAAARTEVQFMTHDERKAAAADAAQAAALGGVERRTLDQARLDALVDIAELAARAAGSEIDPLRILGDRSTGVRVHVQAADLEAGTGFSYFEAKTAGVGAPAISIETITRLICSSGVLPVLFDGLTPIDAGHTKRLHSNRQRIAIAAAWGGCAWLGCDQPEHACEIHHRDAWDGSNTTLEQGVPLCRFHHVELHTHGWSLWLDPDGTESPGGTLWLIPPPGHPAPARQILRSKSPLRRAA